MLQERIFILIKILELDTYVATQISKLSEGNKRKVSLLISMVHTPELLIFDEPTKGVDQIVGADLVLAI